MPYLYETHMHTRPGSACAVCSGREAARFYKESGYTGVIITDHFMHGNTGVPRDLPWAQWVEAFCSGYEEARAEGERIGLDVYFGFEERFEGDEFLIYGLDKQWLLAHPEVTGFSREEMHRALRSAGGCMVQAHPFRERVYIPEIHLSPRYTDAAEVANPGNTPGEDALAFRYAELASLPMTAGSDFHAPCPEARLMGVLFEQKWEGLHNYIGTILRREPYALRIPEGRPREVGAVSLPIIIHDGEGNSVKFPPRV